ncbi:hypothetical protein PG984_010160 [Apiospora sp. TS-2023a]
MPRKPNCSMKSHGFTIIPHKPNRGFRTVPRKPRHHMESHSFDDDDAPHSQSASHKLEASRHMQDMKRLRGDIISGRDRKTGFVEQSDPHDESSDEADDSPYYLTKASNRAEPARLAGFQLQQHDDLAWYSRRPEPEKKSTDKAARGMKVLAWGKQKTTL